MTSYAAPGAGDDVLYLNIAIADASARDGGGGTDTIVVNAARAETEFVKIHGGFDFKTEASPPYNQYVSIYNTERIAFSDGVLAFDLDGNAGQTFRLYRAAFDRAPDTDGMEFWIRQFDTGHVGLRSMAGNFLASPEFVATFGTEATVPDDRFIDLLYLHTLSRAADADGKAYWTALMEEGLSRADLLVHFSESAENQDQVAPSIVNGIWLPHLMFG